MTGTPNVRLSLVSRAENVVLVRQALTGLAEMIGLDPLELNDVSTAVSEACNNVVQHAYGDQIGPLDVEVSISPTALEVAVRDRGVGIDVVPEQGEGRPVGGIGLAVIRALTRRVELRALPEQGLEVLMEFAAKSRAPAPPTQRNGSLAGLRAPEDRADAIAVSVVPASLARGVLPRILCVIAARSHFSTDRIADAELLADALVAHTQGSSPDEAVHVAVGVAPRLLELRIGNFDHGRAQALLRDSAVDGLGPVLERLADGQAVSTEGAVEVLTVRFAARE